MPERIKFLIVSNARSGSTWLEMMLGELPDVATDFEFKWRPRRYAPKPLHIVISDGGFSCADAMDRIKGGTSAVGSKLVLDPRVHTAQEYRDLARTIEPGIRVIHLTRDYADTLFSILRGTDNLLREGYRRSGSALFETLREQTVPRAATAHRGRFPSFPRWMERLAAAAIPEGIKKGLRTRYRHRASVAECRRFLDVMLAHDQWIAGLSSERGHAMRIDYAAVPARFADVTAFVGSNATNAEREKILEDPPTQKLPRVAVDELVSDVGAVRALAAEYQERRDSPVGDAVKKGDG